MVVPQMALVDPGGKKTLSTAFLKPSKKEAGDFSRPLKVGRLFWVFLLLGP